MGTGCDDAAELNRDARPVVTDGGRRNQERSDTRQGRNNRQDRSNTRRNQQSQQGRQSRTRGGARGERNPGQRRSPQRTAGRTYENLPDASLGKKVSAAGCLLVIVGVFLPWVSLPVLFDSTTVTGDDIRGGRIALAIAIAGVVTIAVSPTGRWGRKAWGGVVAIGALAAVIALFLISDPSLVVDDEGMLSPDGDDASTDYGVFVTLVGAIITLGGPLYDKYA